MTREGECGRVSELSGEGAAPEGLLRKRRKKGLTNLGQCGNIIELLGQSAAADERI